MITGKAKRFSRERFRAAAESGLNRAGQVLTEIIDREVKLAVPQVNLVPVFEVEPGFGQGNQPAVAIYLRVHGPMSGHLAMLLEFEGARKIAGLLLGAEAGPQGLGTETVSPLVRSALGEVGNIIGSCLLNALSDHLGFSLRPSTPTVIVDFSGAIVNSLLAEVGQQADQVFLIRTRFFEPEAEIEGSVLLLPEPSSLGDLLDESWQVGRRG